MNQGWIRIEVRPDIRGGWSVTRDSILDGCFSSLEAANDYASACARRARRAGMTVELDVRDAATATWQPPEPDDGHAGRRDLSRDHSCGAGTVGVGATGSGSTGSGGTSGSGAGGGRSGVPGR